MDNIDLFKLIKFYLKGEPAPEPPVITGKTWYEKDALNETWLIKDEQNKTWEEIGG